MTQQPLPPGHDPPTPTADDTGGQHRQATLQTLQKAMRRARCDDAERTGVIADLRAGSLARLDILREALQPLVAQIPPDVDMFDVALMPGANPRLFIDMIGFVEMGRDGHLYRLVQDTRHGRTTIAESTMVDTMVAAVTDYVARRLLERDKALAADGTVTPAKAPVEARDQGAGRAEAGRAKAGKEADRTTPARKPRRLVAFAAATFAFVIDLLGSIAFFTILAGLCWIVWNRLHGPAG